VDKCQSNCNLAEKRLKGQIIFPISMVLPHEALHLFAAREYVAGPGTLKLFEAADRRLVPLGQD
jgi:hypothetical protein